VEENGSIRQEPRTTRYFGLERQTFYDDWAVFKSCGVVRKHGIGKDEGPVLRRDKSWEDSNFGHYGSVRQTPGGGPMSMNLFQMWYVPFHGGVAYAESLDGKNWVKPALSLPDLETDFTDMNGNWHSVPANGTNLLGPLGAYGIHVSGDDVPGARYTAASECLPKSLQGWPRWSDVCALRSEDGITWSRVAGTNGVNPASGAILPGPADSYNFIHWLPLEAKNGGNTWRRDVYQELEKREGGNRTQAPEKLAKGLFVVTTRYDFPVGIEGELLFKWRGIRGIRTTVHRSLESGESEAKYSNLSLVIILSLIIF